MIMRISVLQNSGVTACYCINVCSSTEYYLYIMRLSLDIFRPFLPILKQMDLSEYAQVEMVSTEKETIQDSNNWEKKKGSLEFFYLK